MSVPLQIMPTSLSNGTVGQSYGDTVYGTDGTNVYTNYAITAGALPTGLTLNATSGAITGTPTVAGTYNFTARVTDTGPSTASRAYTVVIAAAVAHGGGTSYGGALPSHIHFPSSPRGCPGEVECYGRIWVFSEVRDGKCYYTRKRNR